MVINEDGVITENQNTQVQNECTNENFKNDKSTENIFDLESNNQLLANLENNTNNSLSAKIDSNVNENKLYESVNENLVEANSLENSENFESIEVIENTNSTENIIDIKNNKNSEISEKKETVETNCLALTVRKDYNFSIAKNTVFKTIRMSIKVAISTFLLHILRLFF